MRRQKVVNAQHPKVDKAELSLHFIPADSLHLAGTVPEDNERK